MSGEAGGAYAQLLSIGLLWISVHCAGMCGPLLIGLDVSGAARGVGAARGMGHVLGYQLGRALMYALFGAFVGLVGAQLERGFAAAGAAFALAFGMAAFVMAAVRWRDRSQQPTRVAGPAPPGQKKKATSGGWWVARVHRVLGAGGQRRGFAETVALGAMMAFLPCMITFWALGIAATTQSPIHGAGVMVLLVAMTTPMLLGVTLLPRVFTGWLGAKGRQRAQSVLLGISGVWLVMVGLAGFEVVDHVHINVTLWDEPLTLMLW